VIYAGVEVSRKEELFSWAPPGRGKGGHLTPLDFDINFSHIITVAPRVEIQIHFWKKAKFAGSVGHPMTKMLSVSGGLRPPDQGLCPWTPLGALPPDPHYRLVLRTRYGAPQPLTPSAAYDPLEKILWTPLVVLLRRRCHLRRGGLVV